MNPEKITTKSERKKIYKVKKYCAPKKCIEVDKNLKQKYLDDINKNPDINVTYTCAGHEEIISKHLDNDRNKSIIGTEVIKMPPGILFDTYKNNLCEKLEENIPNTKCTSGEIVRTRYRLETINSNKTKNKKWWKDVHKELKRK